MAAPKGNNYSKKFKTSKERKALCDAWCEHLVAGYSKESFPLCDPQTYRVYKEKYPNDFDTKKENKSMRMSRMYWEDRGLKGMNGHILGFNATVWIFNMKNRFGWRDKQDITSNDKEIGFSVKLTDDKE